MEEQISQDTGISVSEEQEFDATEGIYSDEVETTQDVETIEDESVEPQVEEKPKQSKWVKKLLAEKNDLKTRVQQLEEQNTLILLEKKYGEEAASAILELKRQHPTLDDTQAFKLWKQDTPTQQVHEPRRNSTFVWNEARSTSTWTISDAQLKALSQEDYNQAIDKINAGKLKVVNG